MPEKIDDIRKRADAIIAAMQKRNSLIKRLDDMYLLNWTAPKAQDMEGAKITKAPDGRNTVRGVVNLMTATKPAWSVPRDENNDPANDYGDEMELAASAIWAGSNAVQQVVVERDIAQSLTLYDEAYVSITSTADLLNAAKGKGSQWINASIEAAAAETPYIYSIIPPADAYPMMGRTGMLAFVRKSDMMVSEVLETFGSLAQAATKDKKPDASITVYEYWDAVTHAAWTSAGEIMNEEHGLGFIPVVASFASGTRLYRDADKQRQPLLYTMLESGIWERKNLTLTAMYNRLAALGLGATFIHSMGNAEANDLDVDMSVFGGVIRVEPGGKFGLMTENLVDNNILGALNIVNGLIEDSSVYRQAFGAPVQGNDTFATVSLLAQAGRLPLVPIESAAAELLARVMTLTMKWIRNDGQQRTAYDKARMIEIDAAKIPDRVIFDCILDVNLPQDMLRNANIASMLKKEGLADDRWIHENILKIGQTTDMRKRVVAQRYSDLLAQMTMQMRLQQLQQAQQAQNQPPQGPPQQGPGGQGFDPNAGGMPPAEAGQLPINEQPGGMPGELGGMMGGPETMGGIGGYQ